MEEDSEVKYHVASTQPQLSQKTFELKRLSDVKKKISGAKTSSFNHHFSHMSSLKRNTLYECLGKITLLHLQGNEASYAIIEKTVYLFKAQNKFATLYEIQLVTSDSSTVHCSTW